MGPDRPGQQRLPHGGPAPPQGWVLQFHIGDCHLPGPGGWPRCGRLHQRTWAGRDPGSAGVRSEILAPFCKLRPQDKKPFWWWGLLPPGRAVWTGRPSGS
uniref:Signal sequence receptor subunit 2 n=1 Tax=Rousettus aegyptiacus TaxID=9407 RepID=A0A7J8BGU4_ROUAE|nr:signal sequence receptor subunit 2 [Rousettus aegyptiacus]